MKQGPIVFGMFAFLFSILIIHGSWLSGISNGYFLRSLRTEVLAYIIYICLLRINIYIYLLLLILRSRSLPLSLSFCNYLIFAHIR